MDRIELLNKQNNLFLEVCFNIVKVSVNLLNSNYNVIAKYVDISENHIEW